MLACGGTVVPDPPPPPAPHDYQVAFQYIHQASVWHSSTAQVTQPGSYVGDPAYTHDGSLLVAETVADMNDPAHTRELIFVTTNGATTRTIPFLPRSFGVRSDGLRLALVDVNGALATYDIDGTLGPTLATTVGRAFYAPDDTTLVFERDGQIVTMKDDGTNEDVIASGHDPSFDWKGTHVVYVDGDRMNVDVIDRSTHAIQTLFTAPEYEYIWTPVLTPEGADVVFILGTNGGPFSIMRDELASGITDVLVKNIPLFAYQTSPSFELSVAPDVTSK